MSHVQGHICMCVNMQVPCVLYAHIQRVFWGAWLSGRRTHQVHARPREPPPPSVRHVRRHQAGLWASGLPAPGCPGPQDGAGWTEVQERVRAPQARCGQAPSSPQMAWRQVGAGGCHYLPVNGAAG